MTHMRRAVCLAVVLGLISTPALAQQPQTPASARSRTKLWAGTVLGIAGGTAIILGATTLKSPDTTSGNTPKGAYDSCLALKSNPVYRGNDCDVLKGPNTAVVVGGAIAAAAGVALMLIGNANNSVMFVPGGGVSFRHRVRF